MLPLPASPPLEVTVDQPQTLNTQADTVRSLQGQADTPQFTLKDDGASQHWPAVPGYEITGILGRGGMGVVYRARQQGLNRQVALKMVKPDDEDPVQRARFTLEAETVAQFQHPNIIQIYEIGEFQDQHYFSMEFVSGGSYSQTLLGKPQQPLDAARLLEIVARAVHAAHQRGIIHRDLKPANILLTEDGQPKVADFGLAKYSSQASGHTQSGSILGTPSYMPPEQAAARNDQVSALSDVYSLGAILYEALTGRAPFRGFTVWETINQVMHLEPVSPRTLIPTIPLDLETICLKCLQKEPGKRYSSAEALADDLHRFLNHLPIQARTIRWYERVFRWRRRNPALAAALVFIALTLVTATLISGYLAYQANRAASEARANLKIADEQTQLAMKTLEKVVFELQQKLADLPHTQKVRSELLQSALQGLQNISEQLRVQQRVDRSTAHATLQLAETFSQLGDAAGKEDKADPSELFERAIGLFEALYQAEKNDQTTADLAQIYQRYALFNEYSDDSGWELSVEQATRNQERPALQKALKFYRQAVALRRESYARQANAAHTYRLASALSESGYFKNRINLADEARADHEEALKLLKPLTTLQTEQLHDYQAQYARAAMRLGDWHFDLKQNYQQARVHYQQAREMLEKLVSAKPDNIDMQLAWAESYGRLADAIDHLGDKPESLRTYRKELEITQKLEELASTNLHLLIDCSIAYDHVSKLCIALERWNEALDALNKGYALKTRAIQLDPDHRRAHTLLYKPILRRGLVLQKLGKPDEARNALQHGLQLLTTFNNKHPDKETEDYIRQIQDALAELNKTTAIQKQ